MEITICDIQKIKMKKEITIPQEIIRQKIYLIRGEKVMFDRDLAELYGVETKALTRAVRRNKYRFPSDFMFQLSKEEAKILRYHFGTLEMGKYSKYSPLVFTEQGVAMLSSVLNSRRAVRVNIQIIRTFTMLRKILATHKELKEKIDAMESRYDKRFRVIFDTLRLLIKEDKKPKNPLGFRDRHPDVK